MVFVVPTDSVAATWQVVAGSKQVVAYVDTDSIRRNGNRVKTWLKWEWASQQEVPSSYPKKFYKLEKQLQVSDCAEHTLAVAQGVRYAEVDALEVVDSYSVSEKQWQFEEAAPETMGESIIQFACSFGKPKGR